MFLQRFIFFFLIFLVPFTIVRGQSLNELKQKKEKTIKEIEYTNWLLNKTSQNSKASLNKLSLLNEKISLHNQLIDEYNQQLALLQQSIDENQSIIEMMNNDLQKIKDNYARLIQQANRKKGDYNKLIFLLSSETFNQAYKRMLYVRQMTRYRQKQSEQIEAIKQILESKTDALNRQKEEKNRVLIQQMEEISALNNEQSKQSDYYQQLQKRQRELKKHLQYQEKIQNRLEKEIERLIAEEAKKAKEIPRTPEFNELSKNFSKNKGKFPWPVATGIVTDKFGEHAHPVMKNIIIRNSGIDITTEPGEKARAIFNGLVSRIFAIPGGNTAVIIRHGEYMSVYSNLSKVFVKQGDQVALKQEIGEIFSDKEDDNKTILKFQIWKESQKLNPEDWIAK